MAPLSFSGKYFGDPVYTYALKEGIGDGFLTPFKVRQMASTMDTYIRFTLAPLARAERAETAKSTGMDGYEPEMREFLDYVLGSYVKDGIRELGTERLSHFVRSRYGSMNDAKQKLGSTSEIRSAFLDIQRHLFQYNRAHQ